MISLMGENDIQFSKKRESVTTAKLNNAVSKGNTRTAASTCQHTSRDKRMRTTWYLSMRHVVYLSELVLTLL